jgi:hypothetical protein
MYRMTVYIQAVSILKPTSRKYNFVEVSGYNLESS